jgi:NitT/TauT family transport system ATP-binding protein
MDEPFGALDTKTRASLQDLLLSLWRNEEKKKTVIFVTHDVDEAIFLSDRIVIMQPNPGRIYKEIKVPFSRPRIRENITDTELYKSFRNEIVNAFYEAEQEVHHDTEEKISAGNASVVRSINTGSVFAVAGGRKRA